VKTAKFAVELSDEDARALALFLKRVDSGTCESLSDPTNPEEPRQMMSALIAVRCALAKAGYAPR
jgi:hypothetical protein